MPADQLNPSQPDRIADAILAVLGGAPLDATAARLGITPAHLADAIETYRRAGYAALQAQATDRAWYPVHVEFPDSDNAEKAVLTTLAPKLRSLRESQLLAGWWFIRKHPCWRIRLHHNAAFHEVKASVDSILDELVQEGILSWWRRSYYEPEAVAFGGQAGIDIAHDLFCHDTDNFLEYLHRPAPTTGRRELSVLLCCTLFRAAGQEWFECGDIWHRVASQRPPLDDTLTRRLHELAGSLHQLLACDLHPDSPPFSPDHSPTFAAPWATAFHEAGQALITAANSGLLERGIRDILAHHVIFHWNRLGFSARTQSILAHAAKIAVF
jgi:thiopeptide-type bacteriocin biosynthesis protein